jgi:hypothetical protein
VFDGHIDLDVTQTVGGYDFTYKGSSPSYEMIMDITGPIGADAGIGTVEEGYVCAQANVCIINLTDVGRKIVLIPNAVTAENVWVGIGVECL